MKGREAKGTVEKEKPREDGRIYSNGVRQKVEGHPALWVGGGGAEVDVLREPFLTIR